MTRHGSMELSTGTLVVMILGLIIVMGGSVLVWRIVAQGEQLSAELEARHRDALYEVLNRGQLVAVAPASATIDHDEAATFGIGILNRLGTNAVFALSHRVYNESGSLATDWNPVYFETLNVAENANGIALITVQPPPSAARGEYTVIINVTVADQQYDSPRWFTVRVA